MIKISIPFGSVNSGLRTLGIYRNGYNQDLHKILHTLEDSEKILTFRFIKIIEDLALFDFINSDFTRDFRGAELFKYLFAKYNIPKKYVKLNGELNSLFTLLTRLTDCKNPCWLEDGKLLRETIRLVYSDYQECFQINIDIESIDNYIAGVKTNSK